MSLLLKALKQAEAAKADPPDGARGDFSVEGDLELEPAPPGVSAREWVEPPGLLFGTSGLAAEPRPPLSSRLPQLSLVPLTALVAVLVAAAYGVYLYFALQPAGPASSPSAAGVASAPTSPTVLQPRPIEVPEAAALTDREAPATPPVSTVTPRRAPDAPDAPDAPAVDRRAPADAPAQRAPASSPSAGAPLRFRPDQQSSLLAQAYAAYQRGALDEALRLYTRAANGAPNVDALLGLAAIAGVQNREADAQRLYREVLDLEPRNATAQAALLDLLGNTDDRAAESRLKLLIEREPSPHLYQTLGNLYAGQNRWADAQAAYFEAYRGAADNADYAYNLAVSLDHLRQYPSALAYYTKSLALGGTPRFDRSQAEARVQQLKRVP